MEHYQGCETGTGTGTGTVTCQKVGTGNEIN